MACGSASAVIYVDASATGANTGVDWANAFNLLQDGLDAAGASDVIWVAAGTYYPTTMVGGANDRYKTFQMKNEVKIYGGFPDEGTPVWVDRDPDTYETILSGNIGTAGDNGDNCYHVFYHPDGTDLDDSAVIDGFTITGGNADGPGNHGSGGGMYNTNCHPKVMECTFSDNSSDDYGGGMYNNESDPVIAHCTFIGNSASSYGGGIYNYNSDPTVAHCTFTDNTAPNGGGMRNVAGHPSVNRCTFNSNSADDGAGISNGSSDPTVVNSTFIGNAATELGGGFFNDRSDPCVVNCTFIGNVASLYGGGIGNEASNPTIANCILWDNSALSGEQIFSDSNSSPSVIYSDVQDDIPGDGSVYPGTGNIDSNPRIADADGLDGILGTEDDNVRLFGNSPCIDAGDNNAVPAGITTDLDSRPRFIDDQMTIDTGNGAAPIVDMGAYEYRRIYVNAAAVGANNGENWMNAFTLLQHALFMAIVGDEICVAEGTYYPTFSYDLGIGPRGRHFRMKNLVGIYGGFPDTGNPRWKDRDPATYETVLSGDIGTVGDNSDNCYHVFYHPEGINLDRSAVIDGFTITGGNANGTDIDHRYGGGMRNYLCSPTVNQCTFSSNSAHFGGGMDNRSSSRPVLNNCTFSDNSAGYGGGMHNHVSLPTITFSTFSNNSSDYYGGGMYNIDSDAIVSDCTFKYNAADCGAGMSNSSSDPVLSTCTFRENTATTCGGGMYNGQSNSTVINCAFHQNTADYGGGMGNSDSEPIISDKILFTNNSATQDGGAIYNDTSDSIISDCTFLDNSAPHGGGICNVLSDPNVTYCIFTGNQAALEGGGIANRENSNPEVINCVFSGNTAFNNGGGMRNLQSSPFVTNCTFSHNSANLGSGISSQNISNPIVTNCVLWGDPVDLPQIRNDAGSAPIITYTDVQDANARDGNVYPGAGNIDTDPCFVDPDGGDNIIGTGDDNVRLLGDSPCIDAGQNAALPPGITTDLDGSPRFLDDPLTTDTGVGTPPDPIVDMGSYEFMRAQATLNLGQSATLNPSGGTGGPTEDAQVIFENTSGPDGATVTVTQFNSDLHIGEHVFSVMGTTLIIETSLADGEFFATIIVPFTAMDLMGRPWQALDLKYWNGSSWELAVAGNTQNSPGYGGPVGDRFQVADTVVPTLSTDLGDYGVFWNPALREGFVWANVDHTTDFAAALLLGDHEPDGDVDFADFAAFARSWLDRGCGSCGGADLTGDGNVDFYDLKEFTARWLAGK